jgi:hypothetical protein
MSQIGLFEKGHDTGTSKTMPAIGDQFRKTKISLLFTVIEINSNITVNIFHIYLHMPK